MYFKCPHCSTKYTIVYSNHEFRTNIARIQVIVAELEKNVVSKENKLTDEEIEILINDFEKLKKRNEEISQKYKKIYDKCD
ncbi:hypothetical protein CPJCM30710_24820 [Clostridium polyendosporum]|uniref:Uncharacterized protein n=1 Tax=Clostridium polyendosporum TaxID=69208 RepID=A0A919S1W8_9CLOT|nr:hypothetical protein [Clostridium polyendosporum]GIM29816.1 hypothetical protein CPJCM30710_24820 [Clostridium polyendosporum]